MSRKRLLCLLLSCMLVSTMCVPAMATATSAISLTADYTPQADTLKALGLFNGTPSGYELERFATRAEAAVMLVRFLGKDAEAATGDGVHPFSDVPSWAAKSVSYLYKNGLANGINATQFGSNLVATPSQYATFLLRALGYSDKNGDFLWNTALLKGADVGLISANEGTTLASQSSLSRGAMVLLSYNSLYANLKASQTPLVQQLYNQGGVFSIDQMVAATKGDTRLAAQVNAFLGTGSSSETSAASTVGTATSLTTEEVATRSSMVVFLTNYNAAGTEVSIGSGFIIRADGVVVTNYHVMEGAASMTAKLPDGRIFPVASVLSYNEKTDLAILQLSGYVGPALTVADSSSVKVGQNVVTIGNPEGLEYTVSTGIISSIRYSEARGTNDFQISAPISSGSSGGPLLNMNGEVIGINYAGYIEGQNLNFSIPANDLQPLLAALTPQSFAQVLQATQSIAAPTTTTPSTPASDYLHEVEPNNSLEYADVVDPAFTGETQHIIVGTITDNSKDADLYCLVMPVGGTLQVDGFWSSNSAVFEKGWEDDLLIGLLDQNGDVIGAATLRGSGASAYKHLEQYVNPGTYYLIVIQNEGYEYLYLDEEYILYANFSR